MTFLRSFARPVLLAWLLVFALILAGPASVSARVEMLNGRDGVEGDPIDGHDYSGGGGNYDTDGSHTAIGAPATPRIFEFPIMIIVDPRTGLRVVALDPVYVRGFVEFQKLAIGGAK